MTQPSVRALICGDRRWDDPTVIRALIRGIAEIYGADNVTIIQGAARGADHLAMLAAAHLGLSGEAYPAKWDEHGKSAGPIRNQQMLREGKPNVVFAFHDNIAESNGTKDMVARARRADIPVYVIARAQ